MSADQVQPHEAAMQALASTQEHAEGVRQACERLARQLEAQNTPAIVETVVLSATDATERLEAGRIARSIGIYNPSASVVFMGYGGGKASLEARAWSVPPAAALVLPILGEDLEFGADPAVLAAGDVVFFVLRFAFVQPFFFGAL